MAYPVSLSVTPSVWNRNRLTTAFRLILAIPHLILVGGVGALRWRLRVEAYLLLLVDEYPPFSLT